MVAQRCIIKGCKMAIRNNGMGAHNDPVITTCPMGDVMLAMCHLLQYCYRLS